MAGPAEIQVKITADLSDFPEDVIDAIAEKVAAKLREPVIHIHPAQIKPAPGMPRHPWQVWR